MSNIQKSKGKAVGYVRVSTDKQAEKGVSLEAQAEKIVAMATLHDADVEIITDAAESGAHVNRPGLQRVLERVNSRTVQMVIVAKLDRLTRSVKDLAELLDLFQKRGVSLISVAESLDTGSAAGRLVLNIMMAVSQWEREAIGERTQAVLRHKKAHHRVFNHVPYGFLRSGDMLVPVADEQTVIGRARLWRANGWTLRKIASTLNKEGIPTKQGRQWFPQTVKGILSSKMDQPAA